MSGERDYAALLAENERLREALRWIADDSRPLQGDGWDAAEWWKHVASTRREKAIDALAAVPEERG